MKKLWNKFRKWLIKKLGGYVAGPVVEVTFKDVRPLRLYSTMKHVHKDRYHNDERYRYDVQRGLCMNFIEEILQNHPDAVLIEETTHTSFNEAFDTATLRARMEIVPDLTGGRDNELT